MKLRNPKLLSLLRKGCSITFPSGIIIRQVMQDDVIELGMRPSIDEDMISIDSYTLNEQGLEEALEYEESVANFKEEDDELTEQQREEEDWQ
jgi:hypothetical protein